MCSSRTLLALAIASLLPLGMANACGPEFPYRLLSDRAGALDELPEGNFAFEVTRLGQPVPGLAKAGTATLEPYWDEDNQRYMDARVGVERAQLSAEEHSLVTRLRSLEDARQVEADGASLAPELRLYTAGAVAFAQSDMALATEYFRRVLALPATERARRSTWAAYSLGRALAVLAVSAADTVLDETAALQRRQELRQQAREAFRQTREMSIDGLDDPLDLGVASLGEEARLALDEGDWNTAITLYASQASQASPTGYSSLRQLTWALTRMPAEQLHPLLDRPAVQQLLVAQLFSRLDVQDQDIPRLLEILSRAPVQPQIADRLAALSYQRGDYNSTRAFLEHANDGGLTWWLRAKLALQVGDKAAAASAYAQAAKAFPADESWGMRRTENWDYETLKPRCRVEGEMAILALERGDYLEAFDQLYRSGDIYWQDAAEVAERVLSSNELKGYIDAKVAAAPTPKTDDEQYYWQRPLATSARELLGRRLLREGRYAEAVPYFASGDLQQAARDYGLAREQAENAWTAIGRAEGYYRAAQLARQQGLELLGYELSPDEAWSAGSYGIYGNELAKPVEAGGLLTAAEAQLQNANAAQPNRRYHYRWVAADLANRAADLLPPRSQAFAAVLCKASGWINYRDLDGARHYYRRYVQQGPYVEWASNFGFECQEPDFERARELTWSQREQALRQLLRPFKYVLPLGLLVLLASGIYWQRRRRALAIVDKTAEENRHE